MASKIDILVAASNRGHARTMVAAVHEVLPNANVVRLKSGNEALQYLFAVGTFKRRSGGMPSLVLLQRDMPVVSGPCVLDVIRAHPKTRGIPVLMLNGTGSLHIYAAGRHESHKTSNCIRV